MAPSARHAGTEETARKGGKERTMEGSQATVGTTDAADGGLTE